MSITTTEQILLIILATTLAIFLIISIIAGIKIIQILNHIKNISKKAESIADKADAVSTLFQNTAGPIAFTKLVSNIFNSHRQSNKGKSK
jgi:cell division protein FtsL